MGTDAIKRNYDHVWREGSGEKRKGVERRGREGEEDGRLGITEQTPCQPAKLGG